jgi:hypothetical protein
MFCHIRENLPAYRVWVYQRPGLKAKGKETYMAALREEAARHVATPIASNDVELSVVYSTTSPLGERADVDNILKPTLDALKGVAYVDDRQVRAVSSRVFDGVPFCVSPTEYVSLTLVEPLMRSGFRDLIVVSIFSDRRLAELGGKDKVRIRIDDEEREIMIRHAERAAPNPALNPTGLRPAG